MELGDIMSFLAKADTEYLHVVNFESFLFVIYIYSYTFLMHNNNANSLLCVACHFETYFKLNVNAIGSVYSSMLSEIPL